MTSKPTRGGQRTAPYAFTQRGVAILSSVLRSPRAVHVNVEIMRALPASMLGLAALKLTVVRLEKAAWAIHAKNPRYVSRKVVEAFLAKLRRK